MFNQQSELFPPEQTAPPVPQSLIDELKSEKKLIDEATELGNTFLHLHLEFTSNAPSIEQVITFLVDNFGYGIKLYLTDIAENLRSRDDIVGEYANEFLTIEALQDALRGKEEKQKLKDESTLDELFTQSIALGKPEKLIEVVKFVAKLKEYAPYNNMLVYLQRPTATHWATASHWKKAFKRTVRPDAIPIIILQPMGPVMLVYDVEDTDGKPLPPTIGNIFTVSGEFDLTIYAKTIENCKLIGILVKEVALSSTHAGTAIRQSQSNDIKLIIELNQAHSIKTKYATLCHEIAHILLGHLGGDPTGKEWNSRIMLNRNQRELEAEATSYLVCFRAGLFSKSAEYLSIYLSDESDLSKISVDLIMKTAGYIERMGRDTIRPKTKVKKE